MVREFHPELVNENAWNPRAADQSSPSSLARMEGLGLENDTEAGRRLRMFHQLVEPPAEFQPFREYEQKGEASAEGTGQTLNPIEQLQHAWAMLSKRARSAWFWFFDGSIPVGPNPPKAFSTREWLIETVRECRCDPSWKTYTPRVKRETIQSEWHNFLEECKLEKFPGQKDSLIMLNAIERMLKDEHRVDLEPVQTDSDQDLVLITDPSYHGSGVTDEELEALDRAYKAGQCPIGDITRARSQFYLKESTLADYREKLRDFVKEEQRKWIADQKARAANNQHLDSTKPLARTVRYLPVMWDATGKRSFSPTAAHAQSGFLAEECGGTSTEARDYLLSLREGTERIGVRMEVVACPDIERSPWTIPYNDYLASVVLSESETDGPGRTPLWDEEDEYAPDCGPEADPDHLTTWDQNSRNFPFGEPTSRPYNCHITITHAKSGVVERYGPPRRIPIPEEEKKNFTPDAKYYRDYSRTVRKAAKRFRASGALVAEEGQSQWIHVDGRPGSRKADVLVEITKDKHGNPQCGFEADIRLTVASRANPSAKPNPTKYDPLDVRHHHAQRFLHYLNTSGDHLERWEWEWQGETRVVRGLTLNHPYPDDGLNLIRQAQTLRKSLDNPIDEREEQYLRSRIRYLERKGRHLAWSRSFKDGLGTRTIWTYVKVFTSSSLVRTYVDEHQQEKIALSSKTVYPQIEWKWGRSHRITEPVIAEVHVRVSSWLRKEEVQPTADMLKRLGFRYKTTLWENNMSVLVHVFVHSSFANKQLMDASILTRGEFQRKYRKDPPFTRLLTPFHPQAPYSLRILDARMTPVPKDELQPLTEIDDPESRWKRFCEWMQEATSVSSPHNQPMD